MPDKPTSSTAHPRPTPETVRKPPAIESQVRSPSNSNFSDWSHGDGGKK